MFSRFVAIAGWLVVSRLIGWFAVWFDSRLLLLRGFGLWVGFTSMF